MVCESQVRQQSGIKGQRFSATAVSCQEPLEQSNGKGSGRNLGAPGAASRNTVCALDGESKASGRDVRWLREPPANHSMVRVEKNGLLAWLLLPSLCQFTLGL